MWWFSFKFSQISFHTDEYLKFEIPKPLGGKLRPWLQANRGTSALLRRSVCILVDLCTSTVKRRRVSCMFDALDSNFYCVKSLSCSAYLEPIQVFIYVFLYLTMFLPCYCALGISTDNWASYFEYYSAFRSAQWINFTRVLFLRIKQ